MSAKVLNLGYQIYYIGWAALFRRDLLKPTYIIENFNELEIPHNTKLVVLDKDNCFAKPHDLNVLPAFKDRWDQLLTEKEKKYEVVILSNTAGDMVADPHGDLQRALEINTGAAVMRHDRKKPMCFKELQRAYHYDPKDILIVGDRLATDVLLANLVGAQSVWIRPGLHPSVFNKMEMYLNKN